MSNGNVKPDDVAAALNTLCGVTVSTGDLFSVINAAPGSSAQEIAGAICGAFNSTAPRGGPAIMSQQSIRFVLTIKGKSIEISAAKK